MPNDPPAFRTNDPNGSGADASRLPFWRFRATAAVGDAPAGVTLIKAKPYSGPKAPFDANLQGPQEYIILVASPKSVGDVFWATRGLGTDVIYGPQSKPIMWIEVAGGGISVLFGKATGDWQASVGGPVYAFALTPCDAAGTVAVPAPPNINVCTTWVINPVRSTEYLPVKLGDVVAYIPASIVVGGIACDGIVPSLPDVGGSKYSVKQQTGQYTVGYDYVRSHNLAPTDPPSPPPP